MSKGKIKIKIQVNNLFHLCKKEKNQSVYFQRYLFYRNERLNDSLIFYGKFKREKRENRIEKRRLLIQNFVQGKKKTENKMEKKDYLLFGGSLKISIYLLQTFQNNTKTS